MPLAIHCKPEKNHFNSVLFITQGKELFNKKQPSKIYESKKLITFLEKSIRIISSTRVF